MRDFKHGWEKQMSLHAILGILDKLSLGFLFSLPTLLLYLRIEKGVYSNRVFSAVETIAFHSGPTPLNMQLISENTILIK